MSYYLQGFGTAPSIPSAPNALPAIPPKWPWENTTCPSGNYAIKSVDLPDGKKGWYCAQPNVTIDGSDPSKYTPGDSSGRTGFWTLTNTVLVGIGVSIGLTLLVSMIPTPSRKKKDDEDMKKNCDEEEACDYELLPPGIRHAPRVHPERYTEQPHDHLPSQLHPEWEGWLSGGLQGGLPPRFGGQILLPRPGHAAFRSRSRRLPHHHAPRVPSRRCGRARIRLRRREPADGSASASVSLSCRTDAGPSDRAVLHPHFRRRPGAFRGLVAVQLHAGPGSSALPARGRVERHRLRGRHGPSARSTASAPANSAFPGERLSWHPGEADLLGRGPGRRTRRPHHRSQEIMIMRNGILSGASLGDWLDPPDWLYPSGGDSGGDGSGYDYSTTEQPTTPTAPVTCPPGTSQSPFTGDCVSTAPVAQSPGALPKNGVCPQGMIDDPLNPSQFCIWDPKTNTNCPQGQVYDPVKGGCCPGGTMYSTKTGKCETVGGGYIEGGGTPNWSGLNCPYGQVVFGGKCVNLSQVPIPGQTGPKPTPQPAPPKPKPQPTPPPPVHKAAWYTNPFLIGGILLAGGIAAVAYKKHQDRKAHEHALQNPHAGRRGHPQRRFPFRWIARRSRLRRRRRVGLVLERRGRFVEQRWFGFGDLPQRHAPQLLHGRMRARCGRSEQPDLRQRLPPELDLRSVRAGQPHPGRRRYRVRLRQDRTVLRRQQNLQLVRRLRQRCACVKSSRLHQRHRVERRLRLRPAVPRRTVLHPRRVHHQVPRRSGGHRRPREPHGPRQVPVAEGLPRRGGEGRRLPQGLDVRRQDDEVQDRHGRHHRSEGAPSRHEARASHGAGLLVHQPRLHRPRPARSRRRRGGVQEVQAAPRGVLTGGNPLPRSHAASLR